MGRRVRASMVSGLISVVVVCLSAEGGWAQQSVRGRMQPRPGAPEEDVEVEVHEVPVNPPSVDADDAGLHDDELVVGVVVDGQPMAYPIRYLATTEVVDDTVGDTALAPTW